MDKIPNKEEIIDYCRKLNLNIDKKTLDNLNPDSTVQLYITLLTKLGFINNKTLIVEFEFIQSKIFSFGNQHDQVVIIVKLLKILKRFFKELFQDDSFNSYDLFSPISKRTISFLGKIILFMKFKEQEKEVYEKLKEEYKDSLSQLEESNNELNKLKEEEKKIEKRKELEGEKINKINEEIKKIKNEKREIEMKINSNEQLISSLMLNSKEIDNKLNMNLNMIKNLIEKNNNLSSRIVSSPDKIQALLKQTEDLIELQNSDFKELSNNLNYLNVISSNFDNLTKSLNEYYSIFQEFDLINKNLINLNNNILSKQEINNKNNLEIEKINLEIEQMKKKSFEIVQFYNEYSKNNFEIQSKKQNELKNLNQRVNELNNKVNKLENQKKKLENDISDINKSIEDIQTGIKEMEKSYHDNMIVLYNYALKIQKSFSTLRQENIENRNY